jgi:hypothetical protein
VSAPELSVVVPTYGREQVMQRAVRSAIEQNVDLEVIVVDDASPAPLALDDPRVRVVRLSVNSGAAAARNVGVEQARAQWIAFLDSDDVFTPNTLHERLCAARAANDADNIIWACGFRDVWPDGRRHERVPIAAAAPEPFASGCWTCPGSTALFSRAAWVRSGGQDASLRRLEDYEWLLRWALNGGRLDVHPIVGTEISRGERATPAAIATAAGYLRQKHAALAPPLRARLESYLTLESAAASLGHGDLVSGAVSLARSWLMRPRLQTALEPFWTTPQAR